MFSFENQKCKLTDVNPRSEFNGDDTKLAADVKFHVRVANGWLANLHPSLKGSLFCRDADAQKDMVSESDPEWLPNLRFPKLSSSFKWSEEIVGATLTVAHGIKPESNLVFDMARVRGLTIGVSEGGSVDLDFTVQIHPTEKQIGLLCSKIQNETEITLEPPQAAELVDAP
jgi:hypothetical protein